MSRAFWLPCRSSECVELCCTRVSYEPTGDLLEAMIQNGIESGFGDEWIRLGATSEHTVDGSFSERTMAISKPYIGISPLYQGNLTETQDDLNALAERVHRAGIRLNCHANGDVAIDRVLIAYERALKLFPRGDVRPKITHCSPINDDLVRRMKALNVVPAEFSMFVVRWECGHRRSSANSTLAFFDNRFSHCWSSPSGRT